MLRAIQQEQQWKQLCDVLMPLVSCASDQPEEKSSTAANKQWRSFQGFVRYTMYSAWCGEIHVMQAFTVRAENWGADMRCSRGKRRGTGHGIAGGPT